SQGQKRRLEQSLPIHAQDTYISDCEKVLIMVKLINNTLIPANMDTPTNHMRGGLNGRINCDFGHDICENFALIVIFKRHNSLSLVGGFLTIGNESAIQPCH